jgi:hypothetical protein
MIKRGQDVFYFIYPFSALNFVKHFVAMIILHTCLNLLLLFLVFSDIRSFFVFKIDSKLYFLQLAFDKTKTQPNIF